MINKSHCIDFSETETDDSFKVTTTLCDRETDAPIAGEASATVEIKITLSGNADLDYQALKRALQVLAKHERAAMKRELHTYA